MLFHQIQALNNVIYTKGVEKQGTHPLPPSLPLLTESVPIKLAITYKKCIKRDRVKLRERSRKERMKFIAFLHHRHLEQYPKHMMSMTDWEQKLDKKIQLTIYK